MTTSNITNKTSMMGHQIKIRERSKRDQRKMNKISTTRHQPQEIKTMMRHQDQDNNETSRQQQDKTTTTMRDQDNNKTLRLRQDINNKRSRQ